MINDPNFYINKIYKLTFYKTVIVTHVEKESENQIDCKIYFRILDEARKDWVRYIWFSENCRELK